MAIKQADWRRHYLSEHPLVLSHPTQTLLSLPWLYWNRIMILKGFQQQKMNKSENINSVLAWQGRVWTLGHLFLTVSCTFGVSCIDTQNSGHSSLLHHNEGYTGALVVLNVPISSYNSLRTTVLVCCGGAQPFYSSGELSDLSPRAQEWPWSIRPLWLYALQKPRLRFVLMGPAGNFMLPHFQHSGFLWNYSLEVISVSLGPLPLSSAAFSQVLEQVIQNGTRLRVSSCHGCGNHRWEILLTILLGVLYLERQIFMCSYLFSTKRPHLLCPALRNPTLIFSSSQHVHSLQLCPWFLL